MNILIGISFIVLGVLLIILGGEKVKYGPKWLYKPITNEWGVWTLLLGQKYKKIFTIFTIVTRWIFGTMLIVGGLIIIFSPY